MYLRVSHCTKENILHFLHSLILMLKLINFYYSIIVEFMQFHLIFDQ